MAKICNNCATDNVNVTVPYVVHEAEVTRQERQNKRMWIAIIVLVAAWFLTNMIWIGVFNSYDYSSTTEEIIVEQDGGNANYIGNDGVINNGVSENNNPQEEADED